MSEQATEPFAQSAQLAQTFQAALQEAQAWAHAQQVNRAQAIYSALYAAKYSGPRLSPITALRERYVRGELSLGSFECAVEAVLRGSRT